ncbi:MAG: BT_3928 family protein [Bacteroidota bacterium]
MKIITNIARILTGLLFIFSGFIKANDAVGFAYKLVEYFEVFGTHFFIPIALPLAIFICVFEIILGFTLLMGAKVRLTLWLLLLMIVFFTFLTFYSAYFQKVLSCGCFGDAIPLTPWQSFTKDLVLLVLIIILFIGKQFITPIFGQRFENALLVLVIAASTAFPIYTYNYLPVIDFRPYAIGKNIPEQTKGVPDEVKFFYTLKDKKTAETTEVDKWPENWDQNYDYISSRTEVTKKGIDPKIKDFTISNLEGSDYTQDIIENPNYNFLLICYDLDKTETDVFGKVNDFAALCKQDSVPFILLTASTKETIEKFKQETKTTVDFYNSDGTVLKTMIRSNPGLMLIKGGTVIDMWHYHSFPSFSDVKEKYFKK